MKTKEMSNIGEAKVLSYLLERNYAVLVPWGDNERYDLVSDKDGTFKKIQVRTSSLVDGIIKVDLRSSHRRNGSIIHHKYDSSQIDEFMVYCPENDSIYRIPISDVEGKTVIHLRVDSPKKNVPSIQFASKYIQK